MASPAAPASAPVQHRIACIDDEAVLLTALQRVLAGEPVSVATFQDPVLALAEIEKGEFALVISDNQMPGMTGMELLAKLQASKSPARRILLTGATEMTAAIEAFNTRILHGFLNKPWNQDQLIALVRKELAAYKAAASEATSRAQLEQQAKLRGERLIQAMKELKQTQTQLVLMEDCANLEALKAGQSLRSFSFLIVDEREAVRNLLLAALDGAGIAKCHGEPNAPAALAFLRAGEPVDVILSEWSLQGMDGLAFFRQVRESPGPSKNALFILMATHEQREVVEFAKRSGINDYLVKPFRLTALFAAVEKQMPQIAARQAEVAQELTAATVLVVNTHPASRDQIEQLLKLAGVKTMLSATFGPAALALLKEKKPALVVYDTNVKDPDWRELRETFRLEPAAPALVITGVFATQDDWDRLRAQDVTNFLPGPFRQEDLLQAITLAWKLPKV